MTRKDCLYDVGYVGVSKDGLEYMVIERNGRKCKVKFTLTGSIYEVTCESVRTGGIKDYKAPSIAGVGIVGFKGATKHRLYKRWQHMILRCYDTRDSDYKTYGAKGIRVCQRWHYFPHYIEDVEKMENYDKLVQDGANWHLDKDLAGQKLYSPQTVRIISKKENCQERSKRGPHNLIPSKPVIQMDLDGNILNTYDSITEAKKATGIATITYALNGKNKTAGGYKWKLKV